MSKSVDKDAPQTPLSPLVHIIPPFVLIDMVSYLTAADVVRLSATGKALKFLQKDEATWKQLLQRDYPLKEHRHLPLLELFCGPGSILSPSAATPVVAPSTTSTTAGGAATTSHFDPFNTSSFHSPSSPLSKNTSSSSATLAGVPSASQYKVLDIGYQPDSIKWTSMDGWTNSRQINAREGHDQVALEDGVLFMRFGFTNDSSGWLLDPTGPMPHVTEFSPAEGHMGLQGVYGQKMSLISTEYHNEKKEENLKSGSSAKEGKKQQQEEQQQDLKASSVKSEVILQFGGCTAGGYQGMTSTVVLMKTNREDSTVEDTFLHLPHSVIPGRGYQGQCYDSKTGYLYIQGGLLERGNCDNKLYRVEVEKLMEIVKRRDAHARAAGGSQFHTEQGQVAERDAISACVTQMPDPPSSFEPRFGHTLVQLGRKLFISGGYTGSGMFSLMDGDDLTSIWEFDLDSESYRCIVPRVGLSRFLGRCHTACVYGPLILYFGGTTRWSDTLTVFDTRTERLYRPAADAAEDTSGRVLGRVSHCTTLIGTKLYVTGGCLQERPLFRPQCADLADCVHRALSPAEVGVKGEEPEGDESPNNSRENAHDDEEGASDCASSKKPKTTTATSSAKTWSRPMCTPITRLADVHDEEAEEENPASRMRRDFGRNTGGLPPGFAQLLTALTGGDGGGQMSERQAQMIMAQLLNNVEEDDDDDEGQDQEGLPQERGGHWMDDDDEYPSEDDRQVEEGEEGEDEEIEDEDEEQLGTEDEEEEGDSTPAPSSSYPAEGEA